MNIYVGMTMAKKEQRLFQSRKHTSHSYQST